MAGPTPVSALIHAATMVTSGVYMVSRLNFMYSLSHEAMFFMAVVGAFTAFFAATVAFAQKDIKKVLAYSTVSQLGFMFLGCGVGAYSAGVFHVITHGFFKALLFLAAGSVIHGMHEEQDITKMGGLKSLMPKTHMVFMLAWLAICGVIPFSGFFSKDEILWKAFSSQHGSILLWVVGFATALMTATYMTRLYTLTFLGKHRSKNIGHGTSKVVQHKKDHHTQDDHHQESHSGVHESPAVMIVPLQILALLSVIGGFMGVPHLSWIDHWLEPVIPSDHGVRDGIAPSLEWVLMTLSVVLVPLVLMWARKLYINFKDQDPLEVKLPGLYKTLENKWYVDEFFTNTIIKPIHTLSIALWQGFDVAVIDRVVLGLGRVSMWSGQAMRIVQTGSLQFYAFILLSGVAITVGYFIYGIH
jgi:NADH-quinone oxidoreductase subunit L